MITAAVFNAEQIDGIPALEPEPAYVVRYPPVARGLTVGCIKLNSLERQ